jgi:hypothetical protein
MSKTANSMRKVAPFLPVLAALYPFGAAHAWGKDDQKQNRHGKDLRVHVEEMMEQFRRLIYLRRICANR